MKKASPTKPATKPANKPATKPSATTGVKAGPKPVVTNPVKKTAVPVKGKVVGTNAAVKKPATNSPTKKVVAKEEETKIDTPVLVQHECTLTAIGGKIDQVWNNGKIPLVIDGSDNYSTFLKYKGTVVDISEHLVKKAVDKDYSDTEFVELARKKFVYGLKSGSILAFFFDNFVNSFKEIFAEAEFFQDKVKFFNPASFLDKTYYKPTFLRGEEDIDNFGNKGHFESDKDFKMCFVYSSKTTLEEIEAKANLPLSNFELINITA